MKILAVGDLVGENGLEKLKEVLPNIQKEEKIDFTIVNGENVASGMGMNSSNFKALKALNIDVITMGNHTWAKKDIFTFIEDDMIVRPLNYAKGLPGHGYTIVEKNGKKVAVVQLIGRTDMNVLSENPFEKIDKLIKNKLEAEADIIIVDFHAEATAEKIAMSYFLDGKVTAMYGTHTHVQTSDETILKGGTGYITDIGMTGPIQSVIGMDVQTSIKRFSTTLPERYKLAEGPCKLEGVVFDIDDETFHTMDVYRIRIK